MNKEPDFYLYDGDGTREIFDIVHACGRMPWIEHEDQKILLAKISPPSPSEILPLGAKPDILGFKDRTSIPFDISLEDSKIGGAVVFFMHRSAEGNYVPGTPFGIGVLRKHKPEFTEDGQMVWPPRQQK